MLHNAPYKCEHLLLVDEDFLAFLLVHGGAKVSTQSLRTLLILTKTAGGLWSLYELWELLLRRKYLY